MADVRADMAGVLQSFKVAVGDTVAQDQEIAIMESMKMEIPVLSPTAGKITRLAGNPGDFVQEGDVLAVIEA